MSGDAFRVFFDNSLDALLIIDIASGRILGANPATLRLVGHSNGALVGQRLSLLFPHDSPETQQVFLEQVLARRAALKAAELHRADGSVRRVELSVTRIPWGDVEAALVALHDRAAEAESEGLQETIARRTAELREALEQAQDANRVKSEFVSNVSHELRSPLTNLKLYLSLLTRGRPEKRQEYLNTLQREADRLQSLIEGLLDLSRLDLHKTQVNLVPVDLNSTVRDLVLDREASFAERGLQLQLELDPELPLGLADPRLLQQVVSNLLANAINYTPEGGAIALRTKAVQAQDRHWVTISVHDTGPGISPVDREHLFERFYRGDASRRSNISGAGLGLAISREIMARHSGRITVESRPGEGSTFTVWVMAVA